VQCSQSEKNAVPSPTASTGPNHAGPTQLFIGSLHVNITEDDLETIFTEFGEVDKVTLARDESGVSKGYAYVKYKNGDAAKRAMTQVNGQELAGRPLKISLVSGGKDAMEDDDGEKFTDKFLRDIVLNFLIAGRDTTSETLTWCSYFLAKNPRVEAKLVQEIVETHGYDKIPDYDSVKHMPYLTAVIKETLRIYGPVPFDPKAAVEDDVLPNGYKIPKGSSVTWTGWAMGRLKHVWDEPDEFRPERFLGDSSANGGKEIDPYHWIPFQAGPRVCLGMSMAYLEVKVMLVRLLQKYHFQNLPNHPIHFTASVTIFATYGSKMTFQHRVPTEEISNAI